MFNITASTQHRNPISCVWIETGDPRQPLACIWIDSEMRLVPSPLFASEEETEPLLNS